MKHLYNRVRNLIVNPKKTWVEIDAETLTPQQLILKYLLPLAAVPAAAFFIGYSVFGIAVPFAGIYRMAWWQAMLTALTGYVINIAVVLILGILIEQAAPLFGAAKSRIRGLKIAIFCYWPYWIAGILFIIPSLGVVTQLAGLYGLYLLYTGLPIIMNAPENKTKFYSILAIIAALFIHIVLSQIPRLVLYAFGPDLPNI